MPKIENPELHSYGCLMLKTGGGNLVELQNLISSDDIFYTKEFENPKYIRETFHVTLLYGFIDNLDPDDIFSKVKDIIPKTVYLSHIDMFELENSDCIIAKVKPTQELLNVNKKLRDSYQYYSSFDDYIPHVTIAYVKKGKGQEYVESLSKAFRPGDIPTTRLWLSNIDNSEYLSESSILTFNSNFKLMG